ncbi:3613_t:CDS:2 [Ambispora leptoticha]|uniref:3613_t:CDS:1 n=1 Tax=Ambispora leptoticha TaxID=144679 RepID=A0A9N9DUI7_9GLOM|nr:3613_t:CDS:2 [Ambispora leptoticha]
MTDQGWARNETNIGQMAHERFGYDRVYNFDDLFRICNFELERHECVEAVGKVETFSTGE